MKREFFLTHSHGYLPGKRAWTVRGILRTDSPSIVPVRISGATKYDAFCVLADRLEMWGVEAEDIHTGAF